MPVDRQLFSVVAGAAILLLGVAVLFGWALDIPVLKTVFPGLALMTANTAACFVLSGAALMFACATFPGAVIVARGCALLVVAVGALTLIEHVTGTNFGIDELLFSDPVVPGAIRRESPGRMSAAICVGFLAAGAALFIRSKTPGVARFCTATQALGFVVAVIGIVGLVGYTLNYHLLYAWYGYSSVALHTAVGLTLLGTGLWLAGGQGNRTFSDDVRLARLSAGLLFAAAAVSGVMVMFAMQREIEQTVAEGIQSTFSAHLLNLRTTLELRSTRASIVTSRPNMLRNLRALIDDPGNKEYRDVVQGVLNSFAEHGFNAITVSLPDGTEVARMGDVIKSSALEVPIILNAGEASLLWRDGLYMRHHLPIRDARGELGVVVVEQFLETTTEALRIVETLGKTAELMLCRSGKKDFSCFPTRLTQVPFTLPTNSVGADFLAQRAMKMKGISFGKAVDYRGRHVLGSYGAVATSGLVAVLKLDVEEIYRPLAGQFQLTLLLIAAIALGGAFFVWTKVRPLAATLDQHVRERTAELASRTEALRQSEMRERAILDSALDSIISMDHNGNVLEFNPAAKRTFGYRNADVVGKPLAELIIPPAYREGHRQGMKRYAQTRESKIIGRRIELSGMRADGSEFPVEIAIAKIDLHGQTMFTAYLRDITERKREEMLSAANTELSRSNADLEQFAYIASHDLQEPLRMVASYVQLLSRRYKGKLDADADEFIGYAVDGALRMQALLNDILLYSRVGESRPVEEVDCNAALDTALANLRSEIERSGGTVTRDALPVVNGVPAQLAQLFQNLVGNALKYRGNNPPHVRVTAKPNVNEWLFEVADNGIGIAPEYHERIFRIFQRLHTREEYSGTGIGLPLCQKIVQRHGGRIWVESIPGSGSTFCFTMPMKEQHA